MAFFNESSTIQELTKNLSKIYEQYGWEPNLKFRLVAPASGGVTKKFIEVHCFRAVGSDGQLRQFGYIHAHGGKKPTPFGDEEVITRNSPLGKLVRDEDNPLKFHFKVFPIRTSYLRVYVDGEEQEYDSFTVDPTKGEIVFKESVGDAEVSANYGIDDDAPDKPRRLIFFTYEDIITEKFVSGQSLTYDTNSSSYKFPAWVTRIKPGALIVYDNGQLVDSSKYISNMDWDNPVIKFVDGYVPNGNITADFVAPLPGEGGVLEDISVNSFNVGDIKSIIETVYNSMHIINPSFPTAVTFIDEYTAAWNRDSEINMWGNITKNRIAMNFRIDSSPDPVKAYYAPLYIGRVITSGKSPKLNTVIIGGSNAADELPAGTTIQLGEDKKLDYGPNVANGNNGVVLQQTVGGAFYQKHYLSFITHDDKADLSPESKYNPSAYTGKYHISPIYVVHPDDGYVGVLDEIYAVHPKNIAQGNELEVKEEASYELIGVGDGKNKVFHLQRTPKKGSTVNIYVDCSPVTFTRIETEGVGDSDEQLKKIVLDTPPPAGKEVYASYKYEQVYVYNLPTTPRTPFRLEGITPYAPIGWGILKKNEPFE